ncbi:unnamed protein product [Symbiodinium sp. CCMP2592]|nr:unnamed protein product [Symbiodinium sp. CCMP2592]
MWGFFACALTEARLLYHIRSKQPEVRLSTPKHTTAIWSVGASNTRDCLLELEKACGFCLAKPCSASDFMLSKGIMPETMEISDAAKSGDGTTTNVGIKMTGTFQCPECRQKFDSEKAKQLHWKFIHDPNRLLHLVKRLFRSFVFWHVATVVGIRRTEQGPLSSSDGTFETVEAWASGFLFFCSTRTCAYGMAPGS